MACNNMKSSFILVALLLFFLPVYQSSILQVAEQLAEQLVGRLAPKFIKDPYVRKGFKYGPKTFKAARRIKELFDSPSPSPSPSTAPAVEFKHLSDDPRSPPPLTAPAVDSPPPAAPENGMSLLKHYEYDTPPPAAPPTEPPEYSGLSVLKQYFYDFGYINYKETFTDYLDTETKSAIKTYQQFFNLKGDDTLNQIILPRCAVPDLNVSSYDLTSTNKLFWPKGKWFSNDTKVLTYAFRTNNQIPTNVKDVFRDAFDRWSKNLPKLSFNETSSYKTSDIKIGFYQFGDSLQDVGAVGGTIIRLRNNDDKSVGNILLDGTMYWVLPSYDGAFSWKDGEFDLGSMAMHQIGHILGLGHSSDKNSVMYPSINPSQQKKVELTDDDKNSIHQLYTDNEAPTQTQTPGDDKNNNHQLGIAKSGYGGRFTLFGSTTLLLTTLSLGFLLLY